MFIAWTMVACWQNTENGADMTVCCIEVGCEEAANTFGVMTVDESNRVRRFDEKPADPSSIPSKPGTCLASMGNYVFNTEFLFEQLKKDAEREGSGRDFGHDIIPAIIEEHNVFAYPFSEPSHNEQPYWRDVGTLDSFWEANMELVSPEPQLDLYDPQWPIWTYQEQLPPAKFIFDDEERRGMAVDSTVSGGCIISGSKVKKSLLFSNVHVHSYCEIEGAVVLPGVQIGRNCRIKNAIIDRSCIIPEGMTIGYDHQQDKQNGFRVSNKGIVLVTRDMLTGTSKNER